MAVTPSPAAARIASLLSTLADAPTGQVTLAELARRTGISKATAHSLLLGLVQESLVERAGEVPAYRLGPALVPLGKAADRSRDVAGLASRALTELTARYETSSMAGAIDGSEIVVIACQSVPHPFGLEVVTGRRVPLRAPTGTVYVAWSGEPAIHDWIQQANPPLPNPQVRRAIKDLHSSVTGAGAPLSGYEPPGAPPSGRRGRRSVTGRSMNVVGLSAPVWDNNGRISPSPWHSSALPNPLPEASCEASLESSPRRQRVSPISCSGNLLGEPLAQIPPPPPRDLWRDPRHREPTGSRFCRFCGW